MLEAYWNYSCASLGLGIVLGIGYVILFVGRRGRHFPPGPPTLPLIGNLHQIPKTGAYLQFTKWAEQYGGIFSLKLGPATAVVLTDRRLVKNLIDRKSAIYSNRPPAYIMDDLIMQGNHILMMKYGDTFKLFRQILHKHFAETVCEKEYSKLQHAEAAQMMKDFCMEPGRHMEHLKRFSNSIIMSIVYGVRSPDYNTPHLKDLYAMTEQLQKILQPGAAPPVDMFPILKFVPNRWWGGWITMARQYGKDKDALYKGMLNQVLERHAREGSRNSMMDAVIEQQDKLQLTPSQLESLGGALIEGGSEPTSDVLLTFIHTIISHPEAQMEAQAEIDRVIGEDRSPLWSDYEQLPYVSMIIKETMRWRPIGPTGFPHCLTEDDWVDGKFLPKGTTVLVNVWGLHHDPVTIPDPDTFSPERYSTRTQPASKYAVSPDYEERDHYNYGGGRRLCPGIHLAERNLFIAVAKLLWGFDFRPIRNGEGNYVEVDVDVQAAYHDGFLRCPKDFQCEVKPRSEKRRAVIMAEFEAAAQDVLSKYD